MDISNTTRIFAIVTFIVYALVCVVLGNVASRKRSKGMALAKLLCRRRKHGAFWQPAL